MPQGLMRGAVVGAALLQGVQRDGKHHQGTRCGGRWEEGAGKDGGQAALPMPRHWLLQCPRGCLHIWPAKSFMLWDAASEGALIFPFHAMPLFPFHAAWGKLARCVNFTQLIFECHISTKTARTWKGIVSSAWKKPQATLPLQEEELLAKQQSGQCSGG